jgi:hypothetical protein
MKRRTLPIVRGIPRAGVERLAYTGRGNYTRERHAPPRTFDLNSSSSLLFVWFVVKLRIAVILHENLDPALYIV